MEEEYVNCIREFVDVNPLIQSPAPLVFGSKSKDSDEIGKIDSMDSIEQEEIIITHSFNMEAQSKE